MKRLLLVVVLLVLVSATASADLTFPASFDVVEESPDSFRVTVTVPLINGRYLKTHPVLPDAFLPDEEPEAREGSGSLTRTWMAPVDAASLPGGLFGLEGLLGTSQEVRFLLTTLDGRRYETVLRPTRAFFIVPPPPSFLSVISSGAREGTRGAARHVGLWLLLAAVLFSSLSAGRMGGAAALVAAFFLVASGGLSAVSWAGLSDAEAGLRTVSFALGWAAGAAWIALTAVFIRSRLPDCRRVWLFRLVAILAAAWVFYHGAGLIRVYGPGWMAGLQRVRNRLAHRWLLPFATDWTMGRIRAPLLSIALLAAAATAWPRRRRFQTEERTTRLHWVLVLAALIALPVGHWRVRSPLHTARAPSTQRAAPVVRSLLTETYLAFNLSDEDAAFDQLAENLSDELIADVYLDSRRRLTEGTRKGAEVTVKDVRLLSIDPLPGRSADDTFAYLCRWEVTGRVKHWQHIHDRRNVYEGELAIRVDNSRWNIAGLRLNSEEREVVKTERPVSDLSDR